ncbi:Helix-turn-helix type 3 [Cinnamomum micranthum f. kanehirae]|uniref:Helix-turn-helix type 3 n=1 Tax=Cinnamomum micranthum f. kanehirae TaxID=337451 RepID=A0A443P6T6_9MAGN|nr:Helix-turn-helix type 3 [Cinnamomum micranthum f. kanehirae]
MSGIGPISQDWEPVVIRKKAPTSAAKKDEKAVNAARRSGAEIETVRKSAAGTNKAASSSTSLNTRKLDDETENLAPAAGTNKAASSSTSLNTRKLDDETENLAHDRVPTELRKNIQQARMDKKLTQSQLGQLINEKPQVIQEYESGKAIPNQQIITKLERVLGVKLRGLSEPIDVYSEWLDECERGVRMRNWGKWVSEIREPRKKSGFGWEHSQHPRWQRGHMMWPALSIKGDSAVLNFPELAESLPRPATLSPRDVRPPQPRQPPWSC